MCVCVCVQGGTFFDHLPFLSSWRVCMGVCMCVMGAGLTEVEKEVYCLRTCRRI